MPRIAPRRAALTVLPLVAILAISAVLVATRAGSSGGAAPAAADATLATVGRDEIRQSVFDARYQVALTTVRQSGGLPASGTAPYQRFIADLRARVFQSLAFDTVVAQQAALRGVAATQAQVDAEVAQDVTAAGGRSQLATQLAEAGSSLAAYQDETRSRLNEAGLEDVWAHDRATTVLQRLQAGTPFEKVATDFSDDDSSRAKGGALGALSLDVLKSGDPTFYQAVLAGTVGQTTASPVHDPAGYEVLRIDSATPSTRTVHRILVAAPRPYTTKERPEWFYDFVLLALQQGCQAGQVRVADASFPPLCGLSSATPSGAPAPTASATVPASPAITPRPTP